MSLSSGIYSAPASSWNPAVNDTDINATDWNALLADLTTALSTALYKDGQATTTARIPFAQGINSTLATDATSITTGSIITAGGISAQKALWVGGLANIAGAAAFGGLVTRAGSAATTTVAYTATGTTTGAIFDTRVNTGNNAVWGSEGSVAGLITGATGYDAIIRGTSGISFSANDGASLHMRIASTGAIALPGAVSIGSVLDDAGNLIISSTNPTIASGFGTSPSILGNNTAAFKITIGTAPGNSGVIQLPAAPNGWVCYAQNVSTLGATIVRQNLLGTTTQVGLIQYSTSTGAPTNFTAGDVLVCQCFAY